jgi:hypothetical protein
MEKSLIKDAKEEDCRRLNLDAAKKAGWGLRTKQV